MVRLFHSLVLSIGVAVSLTAMAEQPTSLNSLINYSERIALDKIAVLTALKYQPALALQDTLPQPLTDAKSVPLLADSSAVGTEAKRIRATRGQSE
ncbi:MAG: hypothetical protein HWE13_03905 [Gammaproteobacteria bacterium]|nr:hypothetical protein [Gammaproteobacteria bacterium]NVK87240.1 hypothetical protein [Gammaproteobacteria bacterium]